MCGQVTQTSQRQRFFLGIGLVPVGRIRKLGVDVEHEEAEGLSPFACRGCVRQLELTERKVDKMRGFSLKATNRIARYTRSIQDSLPPAAQCRAGFESFDERRLAE